jgi:hypothetical protein
LAVSVASEHDHAEQVVADVALQQDMAEGRLDDERISQRREAGVLTSVSVRRRRHDVSIESIARVQALPEELRRLGLSRQVHGCDARPLKTLPIMRMTSQADALRWLRSQVLWQAREDDHPR